MLSAPVQAQSPTASETEVQAAPAPAEAFPFEIGRVAEATTVYTINASQPATSKLTGQKIRLKIVEKTGADTNTSYYTLATGKYKTVAQLDALLVEIFRRFLASPPSVSGKELGKIGDLKHGGEVRFVAASADMLSFDKFSPNEPVRGTVYSRADVRGLLAALIAPSSN